MHASTLVVLVLTHALAAVTPFAIPIAMEGVFANENNQVVELEVGSPAEVFRLVADFSIKEVRLAQSMTSWSEKSSSFTPALGGSDVVRIGGEVALLPFTFGSTRALDLGCTTCQGVIGMGAESPLWIKFPKKATVTAGATLVDEALKAFGRTLSDDAGKVKCLPGMDELCVVVGRFKGYPVDVTIFFGKPIKRTRLPPDVFTDYIGTKNIEDNNKQSDWGNLKIRLFAEAGTGDDNHIKLRNVDLVTLAKRGGIELMIESSENPLVAEIGLQALHSFMMRRDFTNEDIQVVNWPVRSEYTWWALLLPILAASLLLFWKLTDSGGWNAESVYRKFPWALYRKSRGNGVLMFFGGDPPEPREFTVNNRRVNVRVERFMNNTRLVTEGFVLALVVLVAVLPTTREAMMVHEEFWILALVIGVIMLFWGTLACLIYFSVIPDMFGKLLVGRTAKTKGTPGRRTLFGSPVSMLETVELPAEGNLQSLPPPRFRSLRYSKSERTLRRRAALVGKDEKKKRKQFVDEKRTYLHPRLWIVMGITHEILIFLLMILVLAEGRVETLGITSVMLLSMLIIGNLAYHLMYVCLVQTGPRLVPIWIIFLLTGALVWVTFVVIADMHIVQPWVERTIPNFPEMSFAWRFGVYIFVLWVASGFAQRSAVDHEMRLLEATEAALKEH